MDIFCEKENATTDNCKLNFDIQTHMYSMYEIHAQKWDMYKHIRIIISFSHMYAAYGTQDWILLPVVVQEHVLISMES